MPPRIYMNTPLVYVLDADGVPQRLGDLSGTVLTEAETAETEPVRFTTGVTTQINGEIDLDTVETTGIFEYEQNDLIGLFQSLPETFPGPITELSQLLMAPPTGVVVRRSYDSDRNLVITMCGDAIEHANDSARPAPIDHAELGDYILRVINVYHEIYCGDIFVEGLDFAIDADGCIVTGDKIVIKASETEGSKKDAQMPDSISDELNDFLNSFKIVSDQLYSRNKN